jgi:hypothetical protein
MTTKTAKELSGLDIGKKATVYPEQGFTFTDEIRSVIHGHPIGSPVEPKAPGVWVRFRNVTPVRAFELGDRGDGFRFNGDDIVEVQA